MTETLKARFETAKSHAKKLVAVADHAISNRDRCGSVVRDVGAWLAHGARRCDASERARRERVCQTCEHWQPIPGAEVMHCAQCKCLAAKLWLLNPQWPKEGCKHNAPH